MTAQQTVLKTHVWYLLNTIKIIICCICYKSIFLNVLHFIKCFYNFHNIKIVLEQIIGTIKNISIQNTKINNILCNLKFNLMNYYHL